MNPRTMLAVNVAAIALLAPLFILGPALASGYRLTPWFWLALIVGLAASRALLMFSLAREQVVRQRLLDDIIAAAGGADEPAAVRSPFARAAD